MGRHFNVHPQCLWAEANRRRHVSCGYPCIVPPYVLDEIALQGTEGQRDAVLRTRLLDDSVRFNRALAALHRPRGTARAQGAGGGARAFAAAGAPQARRTIFDAHNQDVLPGDRVRSEGQEPTGDAAADEAYDGLGATFDLYYQEYERNSIDGAGMDLLATVHYEEDYDNAYWDGAQMVFGDGDGVAFNRFTIAVDVIGHELTHGVTQAAGGLIYQRQSGALNESISDVFGSLVKQYAAGEEAADADWLIGEGLFTNKIKGDALRSMAAPGTAYDDPVIGKDPQPAHMKDYVHTTADYGGVHINSGIPNHAFYLLAIALGGHAWESAGLIWYTALLSPRLQPRTGFRGFAGITQRAAARLYGPGSDEAAAVQDAWGAVGIEIGARARSRARGGHGRSRGRADAPWRASPRRRPGRGRADGTAAKAGKGG
jgi:Zn-dependent metalloprotease